MKNYKKEYLNNEILTSTITAGLTRGYPVYKKNVSWKSKMLFKVFLRKKLIKYGEKYKKRLSHKEHIKNINQLSAEITDKYKEILKDACFRIGRTQKLLNLYLKFQWALSWISEPPHCPFDYMIITKLKSDISWTKMNSVREYESLIIKAEEMARKNNLSIAEWELKNWSFTSQQIGPKTLQLILPVDL